MANRSYLYATNSVPSPHQDKQERTMIAISEWAYDVPIVYKLLLSAEPRACSSSIWDVPEEIAIVGDFRGGVDRLERFLQCIKIPSAQPLIEDARTFLGDTNNQGNYFVLECGELFDMEDAPPAEQNADLLREIRDSCEAQAQELLRSLSSQPPPDVKQPGLWGKLFPPRKSPEAPQPDPSALIEELGLGNWSNVLYWNLS